jgi:predicted MFS family arabinose efflux permease
MKRLPLAIWAMVVGAFAMGADEFIVAGVVREIATAFDVSYGAVGHLESVYALGVAVGAPVFTVLGVRFGRRSMLFSTAVVFLLGNVLSALAPTYEWVMAGRVVSATAHGAFLGIAAVFAAELVDPARKGRAVALVFSGLTAATVLGAPIGAAVGQALGWRFTFWTLVVLGGVAILGLLVTLPANANTTRIASTADAAQHHSGHVALSDADLDGLDAHALAHLGGGGHGPTMAEQARALTRPGVWGALVVTLLGYGGVFTSYVYVAPQITDVTGMKPGWITPMLLLFGAGLFVGNHLGGKLADRNLPVAVMLTLGSLAVSLFAMTAAIRTPVTAVVMMFLFGMAAFSVVAPLQLRVMSAAGHAPDVASAANISAFTLGSAIGIYLGGAAIDGGLGLASVNWVGGLMTLAGLAVAALTLRTHNADAHTHTQAGAPVHEHAQAGASVQEPEHAHHHTH